MPEAAAIFRPGFEYVGPLEVCRLRQALGESRARFGRRFFVSAATVKGWELPAGHRHHREVSGPAARLLYWVRQEVEDRPSCRGRMIRLAASGRRI